MHGARWSTHVAAAAVTVCRTDFTGRGELADRQQKLGQMLALLKKVGSVSSHRL